MKDNDEESAIKELQDSGIDAVITIVLLDKSREKYYVPGQIYYSPFVIYHNRFRGYYSSMSLRVYEPGYYELDTRYFWESNLYDMASKKLFYSIQTESFNPASSEAMAHEYSQLIIKNMLKNKILEGNQPQ